jgi:hypothetical protein
MYTRVGFTANPHVVLGTEPIIQATEHGLVKLAAAVMRRP